MKYFASFSQLVESEQLSSISSEVTFLIDLEKEKEGLEEKIKDLTGVVEEKTVDILMLSKEKKSMEEENSAKIAKLILEKDQLVDDHKKVVLNLISDGQKEKKVHLIKTSL